MKKAIILSMLIAACGLLGGAPLKAQSVKRIEFGKGKSSAAVKGNTGNYGVGYLVRARSGQKLVLTLSPAQKVGIKVQSKNGETVLLREARGGTFLIGLEESGDYEIFIGSLSGKPVAFSLNVKIERLTDI
jgi:hypothetical protein